MNSSTRNSSGGGGGFNISGGGDVSTSSEIGSTSGHLSGSSGGGSGPSGNSISGSNLYDIPHSPTPPLQRRLAKSFSVAPAGSQNKGTVLFVFVIILFNLLTV